MGFDSEGRIVAMQVDTLAALGGYLSNFAPSIPGNSYPQTITGLYRTPNLHLRVRGVYINTVPVDAYRGSGRPEATWTSGCLSAVPGNWTSTWSKLGDAILSAGENFHIRRPEGAPTILAIRLPCSRSCCRSQIIRDCDASRHSCAGTAYLWESV